MEKDGAKELQSVFRIELRPPAGDPENVKPSLQIVANEYATRYLEQLGVSPCKKTLDLVGSNIPLTDKCITTTLRAKGHVTDEIQIAVPPVTHHFKVPQVIGAHAVLQLGLANEEAGVFGVEEDEGPTPTASTSTPSSSRAATGRRQDPHNSSSSSKGRKGRTLSGPEPPKEVPGSKFKHMAAKYLHPFYLDLGLAHVQLKELTTNMRPGSAQAAAAGQQQAKLKRSSTVTLQHTTSFAHRIRDVSTSGASEATQGGSPYCLPTGDSPPPGGGRGSAASVHSSYTHHPHQPPHQPQQHQQQHHGRGPPALSHGHTGGRGGSGPGQSPLHRGGGGGRQDDAGSSTTNGWDEKLLRVEISEELLQDLTVSPEVVLTLLAQLEAALTEWFRHQAPETLKGRLTREEFMSCLELLVSQDSICFFITLLNFMHEEFVRASPSYPHDLEAKLNQGAMLSSATMKSDAFPRAGSLLRPAPSSRYQPANMRPPVLNTSRIKLFEKYDIGYKLWAREKAIADTEAAEQAAQAAALAEAQRRSMTDGTSLQQSSFSRGSRTRRGSEHRSSSPTNLHLEPQYSSGTAGWGGGTTGNTRERGVSFGMPTSPQQHHGRSPSPTHSHSPGSHSMRGGARRSSMSHDPGSPLHGRPSGSHFDRRPSPEYSNSPSPLGGGRNMKAAAEKSLAHLPSVQMLQAAVAQGANHVTELGPQDYQALQQARLLMLLREFATLYQRQRATRAGMFFTLPIYLVTMRLLVHMLFSGLYTLWVQTSEGAGALAQMDASLVQLFDPHGYLQRNLSILQSTPTAVSIMAKLPHKSHEPERNHFADVSPLIRAALTDPGSYQARKLLLQGQEQVKARSKYASRHKQKSAHSAGGAGPQSQLSALPRLPPNAPAPMQAAAAAAAAAAADVGGPPPGTLESFTVGSLWLLPQTRLTKAQQQSLYLEAAAAALYGKHPVLGKIGEPAEHTTRDSWVPRQY